MINPVLNGVKDNSTLKLVKSCSRITVDAIPSAQDRASQTSRGVCDQKAESMYLGKIRKPYWNYRFYIRINS